MTCADPRYDIDTEEALAALPTPGKLPADIGKGRIDGETCDRELPGRVARSLY